MNDEDTTIINGMLQSMVTASMFDGWWDSVAEQTRCIRRIKTAATSRTTVDTNMGTATSCTTSGHPTPSVTTPQHQTQTVHGQLSTLSTRHWRRP